jgi:hypothetical protein
VLFSVRARLFRRATLLMSSLVLSKAAERQLLFISKQCGALTLYLPVSFTKLANNPLTHYPLDVPLPSHLRWRYLFAAALSGRTLDDVVDAQDHLGRLRRADQHLQLALVRLPDAQRLHVAHAAAHDVQAGGVVATGVGRAQLHRENAERNTNEFAQQE